MNTLGEALPARMKEIREVYIPAYQECGPGAALAIALMNAGLTRAENALASGDVVDMIRAYQHLMEFEL